MLVQSRVYFKQYYSLIPSHSIPPTSLHSFYMYSSLPFACFLFLCPICVVYDVEPVPVVFFSNCLFTKKMYFTSFIRLHSIPSPICYDVLCPSIAVKFFINKLQLGYDCATSRLRINIVSFRILSQCSPNRTSSLLLLFWHIDVAFI